jgi:hypothetical protein
MSAVSYSWCRSRPVLVSVKRRVGTEKSVTYLLRLRLPCPGEGPTRCRSHSLHDDDAAIQNALIEVLGVPTDDFFQIHHVLPSDHYLHIHRTISAIRSETWEAVRRRLTGPGRPKAVAQRPRGPMGGSPECGHYPASSPAHVSSSSIGSVLFSQSAAVDICRNCAFR